MKKVSIGLLNELAKQQHALNELEMKTYVGGGSGTIDDPYTVAEFDSLLGSCQWSGGYVEYLGYVNFSAFGDGSYYGGYCNHYNGTVSELVQTLIDSGLDQFAGTIISNIPYVSIPLSYYAQEFKDCKAQMIADIINSGYGNEQVNYVVVPGNYSSATIDYSTTMNAYNAKTGELLSSYKLDITGHYTRIK